MPIVAFIAKDVKEVHSGAFHGLLLMIPNMYQIAKELSSFDRYLPAQVFVGISIIAWQLSSIS